MAKRKMSKKQMKMNAQRLLKEQNKKNEKEVELALLSGRRLQEVTNMAKIGDFFDIDAFMAESKKLEEEKGEDVEQRELSSTVSRNGHGQSRYGKEYGGSRRN